MKNKINYTVNALHNQKKVTRCTTSSNMHSQMGQGVILEEKKYEDGIQTKIFSRVNRKWSILQRGKVY